MPIMRIRQLMVTPDMAKEWLSYNSKNRAISKYRVHHLTQVILRGEFMQSGEPVQIAGYLDGTGENAPRVLNGQHRLAAIIEAGIPVELVVIEGVNPASQVVMDTGKTRTFADVLTMNGEHQVSSLAAGVRLAYEFQHNIIKPTGGSRRPTTHVELLEWLEKNPEIRDALAIARRVEVNVHMNRSACAVFIMETMKIEPDDASEFIESLISGANLAEGDPVLALRRWLMNAAQLRLKPRPSMYLAIMFKAWNAARSGRQVKYLAWRTFGSNAEDFPKPI